MLTPQEASRYRAAKHILIVDRQPGARMLLGLLLQSHGHVVRTFVAGEQAWRELLAAPETWDLVLTDEPLAELTARQLERAAEERGCRPPVVLSPQLPVNAAQGQPDLDELLALIASFGSDTAADLSPR